MGSIDLFGTQTWSGSLQYADRLLRSRAQRTGKPIDETIYGGARLTLALAAHLGALDGMTRLDALCQVSELGADPDVEAIENLPLLGRADVLDDAGRLEPDAIAAVVQLRHEFAESLSYATEVWATANVVVMTSADGGYQSFDQADAPDRDK